MEKTLPEKYKSDEFFLNQEVYDSFRSLYELESLKTILSSNYDTLQVKKLNLLYNTIYVDDYKYIMNNILRLEKILKIDLKKSYLRDNLFFIKNDKLYNELDEKSLLLDNDYEIIKRNIEEVKILLAPLEEVIKYNNNKILKYNFIDKAIIKLLKPFSSTHRNFDKFWIYYTTNFKAIISLLERTETDINNFINGYVTLLDAILLQRDQDINFIDNFNKELNVLKEKIIGLKKRDEDNFFEKEKTFVISNIEIELRENALVSVLENKIFFKEYYDWRHFYENVNELTKRCLDTLRPHSVSDWVTIFKYNYLNLIIETQEKELGDFNYNSKDLQRIAEMQEELKKTQKHKILKLWEDKQFSSINEINTRNNIKWLFNYKKNTMYSRSNSLRKIIHEEFNLFTDLFPVVLVNPIVCSSILPLKQNLFDIVLFDEASQLRLEDTYPALIRGKIKVISGDKHQMPPSNFFNSDITIDALDDEDTEEQDNTSEFDKTNPLYLAESESLLEFGNNLNSMVTNTSYLDFHYRSRHPYLIDFSNSAFYGARLIPMPAKNTYKPIRFFQVNGLYESNNTNPSEAKHIINFLKNDYPINNDGSYPTLGIATFNMQQRNLIKDLINEESINDRTFRNKLLQIAQNEDWFVKNLENIQGDERDIIIISTTFGLNAEGKFRQSFGPINTHKGYKLLNVIITRAKKQLYMFTSIPSEIFSFNYYDQIMANGNKGKEVFYAYIDYCKAVEDQDEQKRQNILELLRNKCEEEKIGSNNVFVESPFEQEVYDYLIDYIKTDRIVPQYKMGGYRLDFVLLNEHGKPIIAIECDGAAYHSSEEAYCHDLHRQRVIEQQGIKFFRIFSKSWWPDPNKEIYKLVKFIEEIDSTLLEAIKVHS